MGAVYDLAKRLTELLKDLDFYDYKDSLEIGETEDDAIQKLALELSDNYRYSIPSTIHNIELLQKYGGMNVKQMCESDELLCELNELLNQRMEAVAKTVPNNRDATKSKTVERSSTEGDNTMNKKEKISVLLVEPNKYPKEIEIENTLEAMQKLVGGNIELFSPYEDEISIICNEEGKITGLPLNRAVYDEPAKTEMEYSELKEVFIEAEKNDKHLCGHLVFTQESFDKPYSESERTFEISSDNKAFKPNIGGYSIYGSSLDGKDVCVRLEGYMSAERGGKNGWKLDKCYLVDDKKEMIEIVAGTFFVAGTPSNSDSFVSLTNEQILKYKEMFKYPERFSRTPDGKIYAKPYYPVVSQDAR